MNCLVQFGRVTPPRRSTEWSAAAAAARRALTVGGGGVAEMAAAAARRRRRTGLVSASQMIDGYVPGDLWNDCSATNEV